jgi:hypothetical protein
MPKIFGEAKHDGALCDGSRNLPPKAGPRSERRVTINKNLDRSSTRCSSATRGSM